MTATIYAHPTTCRSLPQLQALQAATGRVAVVTGTVVRLVQLRRQSNNRPGRHCDD